MVYVFNYKNKKKDFYWFFIFNESMYEFWKVYCLKILVVKIIFFYGIKYLVGYRYMKNFIFFSFRWIKIN